MSASGWGDAQARAMPLAEWNDSAVSYPSDRCVARTGIKFTQPVLDTLLLSPVVHPNQESHRLEAIAERFGIKIYDRHTALPDANVTGEIYRLRKEGAASITAEE